MWCEATRCGAASDGDEDRVGEMKRGLARGERVDRLQKALASKDACPLDTRPNGEAEKVLGRTKQIGEYLLDMARPAGLQIGAVFRITWVVHE
jgi:hypothetical protein